MPRPSHVPLLLACGVMLLLSGCAVPRSYTYRFTPGRSAVPVAGGQAVVPSTVPARVKAAVAAGNQIAGLPYEYGGGHGPGVDGGYDCSGATSHILQSAGLLRSPTTSTGFRSYGEPGEGEWVSVYARKGHVFLVVADLRYDTGWTGRGNGPQWSAKSRPATGYTVRHPAGL